MKKIAASILALALITTMCLSALPAIAYALNMTQEQTDIYLMRAREAGLLPDGRWPDNSATRRAEFAAFAVAFYEVVTGREIAGRMAFNDTDDVNVQKMGYLGVVTGDGNGNFSPNALVSREQVAIMLARLAYAVGVTLPTQTPTFADTSAISPWAIDAVGQMQAVGLMEPLFGNRFSPTTVFSRQHSGIAMLWLYDIVQYGIRRVEVWFDGEDITNERLAQLISTGEIPANVTHLRLLRTPIDDLSPLIHLTNLLSLDLALRNLTDIEPLRNLTALRYINLSTSSVVDISPLSGLSNLTELNLWGNNVRDIAPLGNLTGLIDLNLSGNNFTNIQALSYLTNLERLVIGGSSQFNGSIAPLGGLINLTSLSLESAWFRITDYAFIGNLVNLERLSLGGASQLTDISFLQRLPNLSRLAIHGADINDFTPLSFLPSLTELNLQSNNIDDSVLPLIGSLTNLTALHLWNNNITNISALGNLINLRDLELGMNHITDISPISSLTNLQWIFLGDNQIFDISALSGLTNLQILFLENNQVSDISVLFNMTVSQIVLEGNPLSAYQLAELRAAFPRASIHY